ncbi:MAG: AAA family ATPase [bacterium]|nr:AAA family ATPase [bacterium]
MRGDGFAIVTRIVETNGTADEGVRKTSRPAADAPWDQIFVCGYGTQRANQAVVSHDEYSVLHAVFSLFNDGASFQNPELVLLRRPPDLRADIERRLLEVLMLDDPEFEVDDSIAGLEIRGPWGQQPLPALSDGYRSTAQWLLDFIAWLIYADRYTGTTAFGGILLIDEVEQHLHPRWQRHIMQRLRRQFPKTQIVASTHTPLVAAGAVDVEDSMLLRLTQAGAVTTIDKASIAGMRADQVLASEAFGLVTTRSPASQHQISRYAELLGMDRRTEAEDAELRELRERIVEALRWGENDFERTVEKAVDQALAALVHEAPRELIDLEAKRQLREIFGGKKTS